MKNNFGFGRFELLTVIVLIMAIFSFAGYLIIQGANNQKYTTMKNSGIAFSNAVVNNTSSFHNTNVVYLQEVIDQDVFPEIKNPFGGGFCDTTQSRVDTIDGSTYTTLKCGKYLLDQVSFHSNMDDIAVYKVSDWFVNKPKGKDIEERVLYNCEIDGKQVFDEYLDEYFFVYEYNQTYGTDVYYADDIKDDFCEVVSKKFYRTHIIVD